MRIVRVSVEVQREASDSDEDSNKVLVVEKDQIRCERPHGNGPAVMRPRDVRLVEGIQRLVKNYNGK